MSHAFIENDAAVLALLLVTLAVVFRAEKSAHPLLKKFFSVVPSLLLCYFIPSLFSLFGLVDGEKSQLYFVASRYLLPTCLVFLTLSIDFPAITALGKKAVLLFLTGTFGIVIGGPISFLIFGALFPEQNILDGENAIWRGMTTVAGSWIGGGANQTAMKEVYGVGDQVFSTMIAVDVVCANIWMAILLILAGKRERVDKWLGADVSVIETLKERVEAFQSRVARVPTMTDLMTLFAVGFGITGASHFVADILAPAIEKNAPSLARFSLTSTFFWIVVLSTTGGLLLSFTKARELEGIGASKMGSVMLYVLVATIGMKMDLVALKDAPALFVLGIIWLTIHAVILIVVAKITKAPLFFLAVGSQANVGGAASAPIVASAFHPALAPAGVLLAVFGYAIGTYGAWLTGQLLRMLAE